MTTRRTNRNAGRVVGRGAAPAGRGGFTLIEVLIASILLALGTLSLLVLFAGAATQQRVASETTSSLLASKSAEAQIAPRFAGLDALPPAGGGPDRLTQLSDGAWQLLPVFDDGDPDTPSFLTIDPDGDGEIFFLVEERGEVALYNGPPENRDLDDAAGAGYFDHETRGDRQTGVDPLRRDDSEIFVPGRRRNQSIYTFPHSRIDPRSLQAIVVVTDDKPMMPAVDKIGERTFFYRAVAEVGGGVFGPLGAVPVLPDGRDWTPDPDDQYVLFTRNGAPNGTDYILIDTRVDVTPEDIREGEGDIYAEMVSFAILPVYANPNRVITRIYTTSYAYRDDVVIGQQSRVVRDRDGRPQQSYAVLFRNGNGAPPQLAVITYFVRGSNGDAPFDPDIGVDQDGGFYRDPVEGNPVQRVELDLWWDSSLERYYVTADRERDQYALEQGQLLLFERGPQSDAVGADFPVRVVARRTVDGELRGYLDRVPRSEYTAMLESRDDDDPERDLPAYVVRDIVQNRDGGAQWRLSPRDVRIFQID